MDGRPQPDIFVYSVPPKLTRMVNGGLNESVSIQWGLRGTSSVWVSADSWDTEPFRNGACSVPEQEGLLS